MAIRKNPAVIVNWDSGEGRFEMGLNLEQEHPLFQVDVLGDIKHDVEAAYEEAFDDLYPGQRGRTQRKVNQQRRAAAEHMVGKTIQAAVPLRNGDLALELSDGSVVVMCTPTEDVWVRQAQSIEQAQAYANTACPHTWFVDEPTEEDRAAEHQTRANEAVAEVLGIATP